MRHMKKLAALLLALVMALALAVPAVAAENMVTENVEIETEGDHHTYTIYQIFRGTQSDDSAALAVYPDRTGWGRSINGPSLLEALKKDSRFVINGENIFANCVAENPAGVAAILAQYDDNSDEARVFASIASKCTVVHPFDDKPGLDPIKITGNGSVELEPGYYLVMEDDLTSIAAGADLANPAVLQVTKKGPFKVAQKFTIPTVEKLVKKSDGNWGKAASWSIGDDVSFRLVGTLSKSYFDHDAYLCNFHDTISAALRYNNDFKVYVETVNKREEITSYFKVKDGCTIDNCNMRFSCTNLKTIPNVTITADSKIVVEYTAKLLATAAIGKKGNVNEALLEYPYWPQAQAINQYSKITPKATVMVFTNEFDITKVDGADNSKKLQGAEFKLEKDGMYVTVDSDSKVSGWVNTKDAGSTLTSDTDGLVKIIGLGEGAYKLHEIKAPAGYNVLTATIDVVITDVTATDTETGLPKLDNLTIALDGGDAQNGDVTTGLVTATVQNNTGASLPETGGVGTTLFYIIGGMLMVGAAVLLVTRKRMSNAK